MSYFPARTHPLTLVHDPDKLLSDEAVLAALAARGVTLIDEPDPVRLRYQVERAKPFTVQHPLIAVTSDPLRQLPYDLWQQSHHVSLALPVFFPNLAPPVVRALTPTQRWKLSKVAIPPQVLGPQATQVHILRHVFDVNFAALRQPAGLITWLNRYHEQGSILSPLLAERLLSQLRAVPAYRGWPLNELLADRDSFATFVREQWLAFVQQRTGQLVREDLPRYVLDFDADFALQDALPALLRTGALARISIREPERLPSWAHPAVVNTDEDGLPRRLAELLDSMRDRLAGSLANARWSEWQPAARTWAELTALRAALAGRLEASQIAIYREMQKQIDDAFLAWLRRLYAPLGAQRLPTPHHVHHVPHFLAYERRQGAAHHVALLVLDGMSLADWHVVGERWRARHTDWHFREHLLLAQIPTITAVSRQALVSGLRPAEFADTLDGNGAEPRQWRAFGAREGLPVDACAYARITAGSDELSTLLDSPRLQALCLIASTIDEIAHSATLGVAEVQSALRLWLDTQSAAVEDTIAALLNRHYAVYLVSDHGHTEARGIGQPSEGLIVQTRGRRARIYGDELAARSVQQSFAHSILWNRDGLLPDSAWVLMPAGRSAFARYDEVVVTHGGPTLDEVVVPFVTITFGPAQ